MGGFIMMLLRGLAASAFVREVVVRITAALGIGVVTYTAVGPLMDQAEAAIISNFGGMSSSMLGVLALGRVDDAISVVISGCVVRLGMMGMTAAGSISRRTVKTPT